MTDTPIAAGTALFPAGPPPSSPTTTAEPTTAPSNPSKPSVLPPTTTGTSERYAQGLALAVSRASATDPLSVLFMGEKLAPGRSVAGLDLAALQRMVRKSAETRLAVKLAHGAFVAEAAGFAAVACWEPGRTYAVMREWLYPIAERVSRGRYWKLSLMARDPGVLYVPGAVRAVLVPFIERFTSEHNEGSAMPVWLEAGSEQARDVYAHFGFRDVGEIEVGGIKTWAMVYTGNIDIESREARAA
ncbi:hypothetical protein GGR54DRAFT_634968 [Hypoxylon sp. NC1633]|nr:hypothetical protein GGR54DRAFT_634968 [Hypoxylon sp. NC1633]